MSNDDNMCSRCDWSHCIFNSECGSPNENIGQHECQDGLNHSHVHMASVWRRITLCKISLWCGIRVDVIEETESEWWNSWLRIVELRKGDFGVWNEWPSSNTQVTKLIFETFEDTSLEVRVVNLALARSCELIRKRFYFVQKLSDRKVTLFDTSQLHMNLKNTGIGGGVVHISWEEERPQLVAWFH